ncbi:MAG: metallophosphoesterase [Lewinellaceae bacterium]|nr:metallophosphoesterase [Lewinellaceae bacterium]
MKFHILFFTLCLGASLHAQTFFKIDSSFFDGPYVFYQDDQLVARWVQEGNLREDTLLPGEQLLLAPEVSSSFLPSFLDPEATFQPDTVISFQGVKKLVAISDIHGKYQLMVDLLRIHGVIDPQNHWAFGTGHLVVVGDIFDRGENVLDILWLVYNLEQEAKEAGGMVHYILGNHELMNLGNDLRYVNKKYRYTTVMLKRPYPQLFGPDTYLGRWIRSKPVVITINDMVFVHAGLSETCLNLGLSFEEINADFRTRIIDQPEESIQSDPVLRVLDGEDGPLWYRGYFRDDFSKVRAQALLHRLGKKHIIVGHTPFPQITSLFKRKVIGVDSSIQLGTDGEVLIYEEGKFYRGLLSGEKVKLK